MTLEETILHCEEVAEKNECKMTSDDGYTDVSMKQCAADHRQLAEWLTELKDLREENKVLMHECDRLIKEKGELLSKVSIGEICQLEEQIKDWKEEYANLNKISYGFYKELKEAKRLLKAAVEDFRFLESHSEDEEGNCLINYNGLKIDCKICPLNNAGICDPKIGCRWNHEAEALALIGEEGENDA